MKLFHRGIQIILLGPVLLLLLSLFAFLVNSPKSIVQAFRIPSAAMAPTLIVGDQVLVNMFRYSIRVIAKDNASEPLLRYGKPARGDVVVFTLSDDPTTEKDESQINIIKRVVGLPGEEIRLEKTKLYINDTFVHEAYAQYQLGGIKDFGPATVPPDSVFVLGDNRDFSKDSRYWDEPFVKIERLVGKAFLIYFNFKESGRAFVPVS